MMCGVLLVFLTIWKIKKKEYPEFPLGTIFIGFQIFLQQNIRTILYLGFRYNLNVTNTCFMATIFVKTVGISINYGDVLSARYIFKNFKWYYQFGFLLMFLGNQLYEITSYHFIVNPLIWCFKKIS